MSVKEFDYTGAQVAIPGQVPSGASDIPTKAYADAILGGTTYSPTTITAPDLGSIMVYNGMVWQAVSWLDNLKLRSLSSGASEHAGYPENGMFEFIDGALYFTTNTARTLLTPICAVGNAESLGVGAAYANKLAVNLPVPGRYFAIATYQAYGTIQVRLDLDGFPVAEDSYTVGGSYPTSNFTIAGIVTASAGGWLRLQYIATAIKNVRLSVQGIA